MEMPSQLRIALCLATALGAIALLAFLSVAGHYEAAVAETVSFAAPPKPELKPAPSTPIAEMKAELGDDETWQPEWDAIVEKVLPPELLSSHAGRDVKQFCPRFNGMREGDKRAYWAYFFQALSGAEAGLRATSNVQHSEPEVAVEDGVSHRMVRSEGLLQLTYEDVDRYGCEFDWKADRKLAEHDPDKTILQPRNNLECGVKILRSQLIDHRKPLLSKSSYWSTLRPGWPGYRIFLQQMANVPEACGEVRMPEKASGNAPSFSLEGGH